MQRILQDKIRLIILLVFPLLMVGMFAVLKVSVLTIGVVDSDKSALSSQLIKHLESQDGVKVSLLNDDDVKDATVSHRVDYSIMIEKDFESNIIAGKKTEIQEFYTDQKEKLFYERSIINTFVNNMQMLSTGAGHNQEKFETMLKTYSNEKLTVFNAAAKEAEKEKARLAFGFIAQFMLYMSIVTAGLLLEDKSSGVFYRVFYAPISLKKYLSANILCYILIAVAQVTIMLAALRFLFGFELGEHPLAMYLLFLAFAVACVGLGILLVSLFKKPMHAYLAIILITTLLVMFGGCYFPGDKMPEIITKIGLLEPAAWLMSGVDKVLYNSADITAIGSNIMIIFLFAAIFFASGLFRKVDIAKQ
jgi:ABC-2 type transport system permease protein